MGICNYVTWPWLIHFRWIVVLFKNGSSMSCKSKIMWVLRRLNIFNIFNGPRLCAILAELGWNRVVKWARRPCFSKVGQDAEAARGQPGKVFYFSKSPSAFHRIHRNHSKHTHSFIDSLNYRLYSQIVSGYCCGALPFCAAMSFYFSSFAGGCWGSFWCPVCTANSGIGCSTSCSFQKGPKNCHGGVVASLGWSLREQLEQKILISSQWELGYEKICMNI